MKIAWIAGIVLVIVIILVISVKYGEIRFNKQVDKEIRTMLRDVDNTTSRTITEEDITDLPEPVQRWLRYSRVIGKEEVKTVSLKQEGTFKTGPDKSWMPFKAEQYYTVEEPAFIWRVKMKAGPGLSITGRDKYSQGQGNMLIKLLSLITVADARGPEVDQGTLIRYLNEIMWFPSAALSDHIEWEGLGENSARATITHEGLTTSADFYFDKEGKLINFRADRYMDDKGEFRLETWTTPITEYDIREELRIPVAGKGVWELESGDFTYIRLNIVDIEYNADYN